FFSSRRRHTRFSRDWSSDVCSSDLLLATALVLPATGGAVAQTSGGIGGSTSSSVGGSMTGGSNAQADTNTNVQGGATTIDRLSRSEERRVGKECRSRGMPDQ